MAKPRRVFTPGSIFVSGTTITSTIRGWTWTKDEGLMVEHMDGFKCRSDWRTLPAFLKAVRDGRERSVTES